MSAPPYTPERQQRQPERLGQAEHHDRGAEDRQRHEERRPHVARGGDLGERQADHQRADRRHRPHHPEAVRPDVQHVAGEHRQQAHDAAEQHRHQVDRDRAQHKLVAPDVGEPAEDHRQAERLGCLDLQAGADRPDRGRRHREGRQDHPVHAVAGPGDQQAAERRPDQLCRLAGRGRVGDRVRELRPRDQIRQDRLAGCVEERARRPVQHQHRQDRPDRATVVRQDRDQQSDHDHVGQVAGDLDALAVEPVGRQAGDQEQRQRRGELREPDQSEVHRVSGDLVDVPADRDGQGLHGDGVAGPPADEQQEVAVAQERRRFGGVHRRGTLVGQGDGLYAAFSRLSRGCCCR